MGNRRNEKGQGLVELALLLPILLVVVMGAIDFGRVYFAYIAIANAAREGAFYVSLNPTASNASVQGIVDAELNGHLDGGAQVTAVGGSRSSGAEVTVTVQHSFQAITTAILGQRTFPVRATAAMVVQ
ncbi:MAG TPA: TadE/TadG family type IV pilus assembly protein [Chloroflexota bacterium]|nr:TadE/TadG family type IV pilus assembly protein [Chloroflexota bacterium]